VPALDPLVASIQTLLVLLGYDAGPADGALGPRTRAAIIAFQQRVGETPDGRPTDGLRNRLQAAATQQAGATAKPQVGKPETRPVGAGTGFFINRDILITNNHVIEGCYEIRLRKRGTEIATAKLVAANRSDDLAALQVSERSDHFLRLRVGAPVRTAEAVIVFGYPLSFALSSLGNTTFGNVTALSGLRDDSRFIQISAAVQPGNSGEPVLDEAGRLMGVVVGKLDALRAIQAIGDIPQNVNFAIRGSTLEAFLEVNQVPFEVATEVSSLPAVEIAERAEKASAQIECRK
jgi:S1-C subfamily serine protease